MSSQIIGFSLTALLATIGFSPFGVRAATFDIPVSPDDRIIFNDGAARPENDLNARVGLGFNGFSSSVYVLPFQLPALPPGERVVAAKLVLNLEGWSNFSSVLQNLDLYGINGIGTSSEPDYSGIYIDGAAPVSNPNAMLLQNDLLTAASISSTAATGQTNPVVSGDFAPFVQNLYDGGASAGSYVYLVLTHDAAIFLQRYYLLSSSNSTTFAVPRLSLTTKYVGNSYYLDSAIGNDTAVGTEAAPWKTFARAQHSLQPGDSLYCSGTLGRINMTSASPKGTADRWIAYKPWEGRPVPYATALVFDGIKADRYLTFQGFRFAPGEVDSASYTENNAIYLAGGWYITFDDCDIEGARLAITPGAVDPASGFAPYTPVAPYPPPAVTAGTPGDASYITIKNCRIKYSAIGISVTENPAYTTKRARNWVIIDNDIEEASEDGIRLASQGGGSSYIARNYIYNQNFYRYPFNWGGQPSSAGAWNGRKWQKITQAGTDASAIFYKLEPMTDGRMKFYVLANDKDHLPARNTTGRWVLDSDPTVYFDPLTVDGNPTTGDNAHTDGIAVMGPSQDVMWDANAVEVSKYGGAGMKIENLGGHPKNHTFQNNLFYAMPAINPALGAYLLNIAGGDNCVFKQNTIFAGSNSPLARAIRFNDTTGTGFGSLYFYNNIISGGGASNTGSTNIAVSDYNLWISTPQPSFQLGAHDVILPARSTYLAVKFADAPAGDLHLQSTSPARNIGSISASTSTPTDADGLPRVGLPDVGAFEEQTP